MDTEKHIEIQNSINRGRPPAEEGLHSADLWWESHKSNVKGYLFGTAAYAGIGAVIGGATATVLLVLAHTANPIAAIPITAGLAAAGLLYSVRGLHKLPKIKRLTQCRRKTSAQQKQPAEKTKEKSDPLSFVTVVYPPELANFPASDTYSRDKLAAAKLALLTLDPAKSIRQ